MKYEIIKIIKYVKFKKELLLGVACLSFFLISFSTASASEIGDSQTFFVDSSYDYSARPSVEATLKNLSSHGYFYVEDDYFNGLSKAEQNIFLDHLSSLANDFDNTIYYTDRNVFGVEWSPGIDNDNHITILLSQLAKRAGGYFNPNNEYQKEMINGGASNEREMIYLNSEFISDPRMSSFLAHEFQHLITWYHKTKLHGVVDDIWLNEGRSEYAPTANGFDNQYDGSNLKARVEQFKNSPDDSLTEWRGRIEDYPPVNLFIQYLVDHFGKNILKKIVENDKVGIASVNEALKDTGNPENFYDVFTDWTVANYLNDSTVGNNKKFGYLNSNLSYQNFHLEPSSTTFIGNDTVINFSASIKDWSSRRYEIKPTDLINDKKNTLEFSFNGGNSKKFRVPYVLFYRDGEKKVSYLDLDENQDGKILINNFGSSVSRLTVIPSSQVKVSGFGNSEPLSAFSYSAKLIKSTAAVVQKYPDGSLLRAKGGEKVYLIENNKKRWITTAEVFSSRYNWSDIQDVFSGDLDDIETGKNINKLGDGSLVKGTSEKVYLIEDGKKKWIVDAFTFNHRKYQWENIYQISDEDLNNYPEGENILDTSPYPDGTLVRGSCYKVYLIENGQKKWISSEEVFNARGYKWDKVIVVSNDDLENYPEGERIE